MDSIRVKPSYVSKRGIPLLYPGVTVNMVNHAIASGKLYAEKAGKRKYLISVTNVDKWLCGEKNEQ